MQLSLLQEITYLFEINLILSVNQYWSDIFSFFWSWSKKIFFYSKWSFPMYLQRNLFSSIISKVHQNSSWSFLQAKWIPLHFHLKASKVLQTFKATFIKFITSGQKFFWQRVHFQISVNEDSASFLYTF